MLCEETQAHREKAMGRQAEIGVMEPQAKDCWPPAEGGENKGPSLEPPEGAWFCIQVQLTT